MRLFSLSLCLVLGCQLFAQPLGGKSTYDFIDLPASPRVTGAGGNLIATRDDDASLAYHNPALLNPRMDNHVTFSDALYIDKLNHGYFGYVRDYPKIATFQAGIQYISYGSFQQTDEVGNTTGNFKAGEFAINLGASRQLDKYCYGANLKLIYSSLGGYTSVGTAVDLAAAYDDTAKQLTATLLIKNVGVELKSYYKGATHEMAPFDVQFGFSKRFKHLPFRIGVIVHHLTSWDIRYDDPNDVATTNLLVSDTTKASPSQNIPDKIARHFIFNGELYITKYFRFTAGYNHLRRAELAPGVKKGLAGFSFGIGILIKQYQFGLARARYSGSQATTQFSFAMNLNQVIKKKKDPTAQ